MAETISIYATTGRNGHGAGPASKYSYKIDAPLKVTCRKAQPENNLVQRVTEARKLGVSYGRYMAMLHDGLFNDPLKREE